MTLTEESGTDIQTTTPVSLFYLHIRTLVSPPPPPFYRVHLTSFHASEWEWKTWKPFKDSDHMLACSLQLAENSGTLSTGNNYYDRQFSALLLSNHRKYIKILIQRNNFHVQTLQTTFWSSDTFTLIVMSNKFQEACLMCNVHIETCYSV